MYTLNTHPLDSNNTSIPKDSPSPPTATSSIQPHTAFRHPQVNPLEQANTSNLLSKNSNSLTALSSHLDSRISNNSNLRSIEFEKAIEEFSVSPDRLLKWINDYPDTINKEIIRIESSNKTAGPLSQTNLGSPIYYACVLGLDEVIECLLQSGCDPDYRHPSGDTAILHCVEQGYDDCLSIFLSHGSNFTQHTTENRQFSLGQNVKISQEGGLNPLGLAIKNLRMDIIELLLEHPNSQELVSQNNQFGRNAKEQVIDFIQVSEKKSRRSLELNKILDLLNKSQPHIHANVNSAQKVKDQEKQKNQIIREACVKVEQENRQKLINDGLQLIEKNYKKLHPNVYNIKPSSEGHASSTVHIEHIGSPDNAVGSYFLMEPDMCQMVLEEILNYENKAIQNIEDTLPLHVRHDGNLGELQNCGFKPIFEYMVKQSIPAFKEIINKDYEHLDENNILERLDITHAFLTRNHPFAEKTFKIHQDKSDYTLNLCLHASNNLEGSTVGFYQHDPIKHQEGHLQPDKKDKVFTYHHQVGTAALHSGKTWHCTDPITEGSRASLIIWLTDKNRV